MFTLYQQVISLTSLGKRRFNLKAMKASVLSRPFHTVYDLSMTVNKKRCEKEMKAGAMKPGLSFLKRLRVILELNGNQAKIDIFFN